MKGNPKSIYRTVETGAGTSLRLYAPASRIPSVTILKRIPAHVEARLQGWNSWRIIEVRGDLMSSVEAGTFARDLARNLSRTRHICCLPSSIEKAKVRR